MYYWTDEEEQYLRKNFRDKSAFEMAEHLNRSEQAVEAKIHRMNLHRYERTNHVEQLRLIKHDSWLIDYHFSVVKRFMLEYPERTRLEIMDEKLCLIIKSKM